MKKFLLVALLCPVPSKVDAQVVVQTWAAHRVMLAQKQAPLNFLLIGSRMTL